MQSDLRAPEEVVLTRLLRLNAMVYGIVAGLVAGLCLFAATNWLVLKGGPDVGRHLSLLSQFFPGYQVTFLGSLIGFAYAFVCAFLIGYFVARIYNALAYRREAGRKPSA